MVDIKGKIMEGKHREKMFALHFYDGVCWYFYDTPVAKWCVRMQRASSKGSTRLYDQSCWYLYDTPMTSPNMHYHWRS
jgi:hypothetical protein